MAMHIYVSGFKGQLRRNANILDNAIFDGGFIGSKVDSICIIVPANRAQF